MSFKANCHATGIGSVPFAEAGEGLDFVLNSFPKIPFWPQLSRRSFLENMYAQYSQRLPGVVVEGEKIYVKKKRAYDELESFYENFLSEDLDPFAISSEYAQGLYALLERGGDLKDLAAIKGHVTGPISFGLQVTFQDKRAIIYDDSLRDAMVKNIVRKAAWQESLLKQLCPNTIIFVDEPYLSAFGSAYINLLRDEVINLLNEVFAGIAGLSAVHCCGNTDWSLLLDTEVNIINLDAFEYADMLLLYPDKLHDFLERDGIIAWGICPTLEDKIQEGMEDELIGMLDNIFAKLVSNGISQDKVLRQSLITPACGVGGLSRKQAEVVFSQTRRISEKLRERLT